MGLHRGDRLEFLLEPDGSVHLRPLVRSVRDLAGLIQRSGRPPVTLEEMEDTLLEHLAAEDDRIRKGE